MKIKAGILLVGHVLYLGGIFPGVFVIGLDGFLVSFAGAGICGLAFFPFESRREKLLFVIYVTGGVISLLLAVPAASV
jgi:hypothetical protein